MRRHCGDTRIPARVAEDRHAAIDHGQLHAVPVALGVVGAWDRSVGLQHEIEGRRRDEGTDDEGVEEASAR